MLVELPESETYQNSWLITVIFHLNLNCLHKFYSDLAAECFANTCCTKKQTYIVTFNGQFILTHTKKNNLSVSFYMFWYMYTSIQYSKVLYLTYVLWVQSQSFPIRILSLTLSLTLTITVTLTLTLTLKLSLSLTIALSLLLFQTSWWGTFAIALCCVLEIDW